MFKTYFIFFTLILNAAVLLAHPAKDTTLSFDNKTKMLSVSVLHDSRDRKKHFIEEIRVSVNGKELVKQNFQSQTSNASQDASYVLIDVKPGDEVAVKSECNLGGSLVTKMRVFLK
ncbi:MAG: hypothetical protein LHV68_10390 [Elusimicrobia bacterium]|nr:hypothetical protein [Candidatus Liberimonas magnetica]